MTLRYAVSFEFQNAPPMTHRGTVSAVSAATCASRAIREAVKAHPGTRWTSLVFVALERLDQQAAESEDAKDLTDEPAEA